MPLMRAAYRVTGASYQPTRRGRPVVVPNSKPRERSHSPSPSNSPGGKGPDPRGAVSRESKRFKPRYLLPTPMPAFGLKKKKKQQANIYTYDTTNEHIRQHQT